MVDICVANPNRVRKLNFLLKNPMTRYDSSVPAIDRSSCSNETLHFSQTGGFDASAFGDSTSSPKSPLSPEKEWQPKEKYINCMYIMFGELLYLASINALSLLMHYHHMQPTKETKVACIL